MTVIAWDGETLAADRRITSGFGIHGTITKIGRFGDVLVGMSGALSHALEMAKWVGEGADPEKFPKPFGETGDILVVHPDGSLTEYCGCPTAMRMVPFKGGHAIGSGGTEARVALYLGKSAIEAVEIACLFDASCGNGIDTLRFDDP